MLRQILLSLLIFSSIQVRPQGCLKDSIISDFVNGKLILINQLSIMNTNETFLNKLLELQFTACEVIGPEKGRELYGTMGENGVISITLFDVEPLRQEYVDLVDASILKYFDNENPLFYHTNGVPNLDMYMALNSLINMKIDRINIIEKSESRAIWGDQAKNGAIVISCDRSEPLSLITK